MRRRRSPGRSTRPTGRSMVYDLYWLTEEEIAVVEGTA
jgi:hypothetical protein